MLDRIAALCVLAVLAAFGPAWAGQVEIVSRVDPALISDTAGGAAWSISADGRFVAFVSSGTNLLPGEPPPAILHDYVYLDDRQTGSLHVVLDVAGYFE